MFHNDLAKHEMTASVTQKNKPLNRFRNVLVCKSQFYYNYAYQLLSYTLSLLFNNVYFKQMMIIALY